MTVDAVELTVRLIAIDTVRGGEAAAHTVLRSVLEPHGFRVDEPAPGNLIARFKGGGRLVLSGHIDTVAYARDQWESDPLAPVRDGDHLIGRGSSDMKSGVAVICAAAVAAATRHPDGPGFTIAITTGEETGCIGARQIAHVLPPRPILLIAESTDNALRFGHRGVAWLNVVAAGVAAHGSSPERGSNAIEALIRALEGVPDRLPRNLHPVLGATTSNLGVITGGEQINIVPAGASALLDIRVPPDASLDPLLRYLRAQPGITKVLEDLRLPPVWTPPDHPTSQTLAAIVASELNVSPETGAPSGTSYFTDAAALISSDGLAYVLGPGDPTQPHSANEWCSVSRIQQAVTIYEKVLYAWFRGDLGDEKT